MKRIKQASAEMEFLQSAKDSEILEYIQQYPFHKTTELHFVATAGNNLLRAYIAAQSLHPASIIVLLKANKRDLVEYLFQTHQSDAAVVKKILDHAEYNTVKYLTDKYEIPELPEQAALKSMSSVDVAEMLHKGNLSPFAKCDIIMRYNEEYVLEVISQGKLQSREFMAVLKNGSLSALRLLADLETQQKRRKLIDQFQILRFGSRKQLKQLLSQRQLMQPAEKFYFKASSFDDLMEYIKKYKPEDGEQALIEHPDRSQILTWLSKMKYPLSEQGEALLLKRSKHAEIKAYIKRHSLEPENEIRFIKRNKHREILLYLSQHSLSAEAQVELIRRGNSNEIFMLMTAYPMSDIAEKTFKELGPLALWNMYNEL